MPIAVLIRLRDGRCIPYRLASDSDVASRLKIHLEHWLRRGMTLSMANAQGDLVDIGPETVEQVELEAVAAAQQACEASAAPALA
jgi:hypothetical protein